MIELRGTSKSYNVICLYANFHEYSESNKANQVEQSDTTKSGEKGRAIRKGMH